MSELARQCREPVDRTGMPAGERSLRTFGPASSEGGEGER
jgi:hypothetical protein